jgi:hypothetical protein
MGIFKLLLFGIALLLQLFIPGTEAIFFDDTERDSDSKQKMKIEYLDNPKPDFNPEGLTKKEIQDRMYDYV